MLIRLCDNQLEDDYLAGESGVLANVGLALDGGGYETTGEVVILRNGVGLVNGSSREGVDTCGTLVGGVDAEHGREMAGALRYEGIGSEGAEHLLAVKPAEELGIAYGIGRASHLAAVAHSLGGGAADGVVDGDGDLGVCIRHGDKDAVENLTLADLLIGAGHTVVGNADTHTALAHLGISGNCGLEGDVLAGGTVNLLYVLKLAVVVPVKASLGDIASSGDAAQGGGYLNFAAGSHFALVGGKERPIGADISRAGLLGTAGPGSGGIVQRTHGTFACHLKFADAYGGLHAAAGHEINLCGLGEGRVFLAGGGAFVVVVEFGGHDIPVGTRVGGGGTPCDDVGVGAVLVEAHGSLVGGVVVAAVGGGEAVGVVEEGITELNDSEFSVDADEHVSAVFEEIGFKDPEDDEELINKVMGAWAFENFHAIPAEGESFEYHHLHVTVERMRHNRIIRLKLSILPEETEGAGEQ